MPIAGGDMTGETLQVLLAEDVGIIRKGFKALLGGFSGVEIAGEAADGIEAVRLALEIEPRVVLMDLSMPRMAGVEAIAEIKRLRPDIRVIALTAHAEAPLALQALSAGADGYLLKSVPAHELVLALRRVAGGGSYVCAEVSGLLASPSSSDNAS